MCQQPVGSVEYEFNFQGTLKRLLRIGVYLEIYKSTFMHVLLFAIDTRHDNKYMLEMNRIQKPCQPRNRSVEILNNVECNSRYKTF